LADSAVGAAVDATTGAAVDATIDVAVDATTGAAVDATTGAAVDATIDAAADQIVVDAAVAPCAPYGQACTKSSDCCNGVPCGGGLLCVFSVRRPFLVGSSLRVAATMERSDWQSDSKTIGPTSNLDPATGEALGRDWLRDACEEHASIAAFARFTMHLMSVGAPPEMIVASQRAGVDEVRHARACFALARRYGGRPVGPAALSLTGAVVPMTLAEIAALTAEEGCVGETLGALLAEEQLLRTTDPLVRSVLVRANIVADEGRHAELAWSFVAWAVAQRGDAVRRAVGAARSMLPVPREGAAPARLGYQNPPGAPQESPGIVGASRRSPSV
jgi:hypothetical protein